MKKFVRQSILLLCTFLVVMLIGCREEQLPSTPGEVSASDVFGETPDPAIARTLQAEAAMTAVWLLTLTPAGRPSVEASPTLEAASMVGTPMAERKGICPIPGGFILQDRDGFCLATPSSWVVFNIDGGAAGFLKTTPDQVISLQPNWAQSTAVCNVMIYISAESSAVDHLNTRYQQFASQQDIQEISLLQAYAVGEMGLLGFTWSYESGEAGAIYADMVGNERLLHISYDGSMCLLDDLLPVLETLRIKEK